MTADSKPLAVMVDLETLGTEAGCPVTEIGMTVFENESGEVISSFHTELSAIMQVRRGAVVSKATEAWWLKTDAAKLAQMMESAEPVEPALERFVSYCDTIDWDNVVGVWAQGQDFDFPILRWTLNLYGHGDLWPFWLHRDTRTAYAEAGFDYKSAPRVGIHHNALDDCYTQIQHLVAARQQLHTTIAEAAIATHLALEAEEEHNAEPEGAPI